MFIIAFGHKKRVGKGEAALHAAHYTQYVTDGKVRPRIVSFARKLKEGVGRVVFGLNDRQLYGDLKEEPIPYWWGMTPRQILQETGTDGLRALYDDIWVKAAFYGYEGQWPMVIDDLRFRNEAEGIREVGERLGIPTRLVRITRYVPGADRDTHPSEHDLDGYSGWDYTFANVGPLSNLHKHVEGLVHDLLFDGER